ncbi:MAG: coenzyme F420-0:L-glutamate ligase [Defluviitaleaceae bacterium]|nr:coenzyme F420-0:L-glutamate ligase [Defluviitaleaceae bacterium]
MRKFGTVAYGIRTPIIHKGDDLVDITARSLSDAVNEHGLQLKPGDILGITEAVVAKSMGNYASLNDIGADVRRKFSIPNDNLELGVVFPILSRNRFLSLLKGITRGADKVYVLLSFPFDEVGNPVMDKETAFNLKDELSGLMSAEEFTQKIGGRFIHPFTDVDYIDLYQSVADNVEVYFSNDCRDILKLTKNVLCADIHTRDFTKRILEKAGANKILTLADILDEPGNNHGYNEKYGLLGSNLATDETVKLFPRDCEGFLEKLRTRVAKDLGVEIEMLVYGDGAFKDPVCGIWELADPVVAVACTPRLTGTPQEIKIKHAADILADEFKGKDKDNAIKEMVRFKSKGYAAGTTPRKYADLVGSLCDLMSGSGDKGTPIILIQGYFDNYADEDGFGSIKKQAHAKHAL